MYIYSYISTISIFDYSLNAVGTIRLSGSILNQFSIDEHNNYLRVVSTNTSMPVTKLNAISIYDLSTLQRVGYLDQDIGLGRQIVKSVRYDNDTCYVVTYENTDPLYEIDLTDVTAPKIAISSVRSSKRLFSFSIAFTGFLRQIRSIISKTDASTVFTPILSTISKVISV